MGVAGWSWGRGRFAKYYCSLFCTGSMFESDLLSRRIEQYGQNLAVNSVHGQNVAVNGNFCGKTRNLLVNGYKNVVIFFCLNSRNIFRKFSWKYWKFLCPDSRPPQIDSAAIRDSNVDIDHQDVVLENSGSGSRTGVVIHPFHPTRSSYRVAPAAEGSVRGVDVLIQE